MFILYAFLLTAFSLYTYALVDPNITFFNAPAWTYFRNTMVQFGYYQRQYSAFVYIVGLCLLFVFHLFFLKNPKKYNVFKLTIVIGLVSLIAYPFLSHDLFNYIFDARIVTHYHMNPYTHTALDFPSDQMTRFMHWTHRTYPYGPAFLPITLIPSFLSLNKFIIAYALFKIMNIAAFTVAVKYLEKWNKEWALFFATHPLVIIDGLINVHNDLLAVALGIIGMYYVFHKADLKGRILLLISGGIKYTTLPLVIMKKNKNDLLTRIGFAGLTLVVLYLTLFMTVQPWYFMTLLVVIPYFYRELKKSAIFFFGVLVSYVNYIYTGSWHLNFMYGAITAGFIVNLIYFYFDGTTRKILHRK